MTHLISSSPSLLRGFVASCDKKGGLAQSHKAEKKKWLLLLALLPTPVIAQFETKLTNVACPDYVYRNAEREPDAEFISCSTTDISVTAARIAQTRNQTGRAVTSFDSEAIKSRQTVSIADILATTSGVTVTRNGGIGGFSAVRIRGAEGEQTLTLIDGVRVNDPSSPGGGFDFGNLLAGNFERVEILRGPNSVPWGSQAIGGIVNIITAAPTEQLTGNARAEYGFKNATNLVGQVSDTFGIISTSLGGGYFKDDGISAFKNGTERDGSRQYAANGKVGVAISDAFDLNFRGYYADSRTDIDGFPPPFFSFADTPEFSTAKELFTYAGANLQLFDDRLKNRVAFTLSDINRDNFDAPGQVVPSFLARGRVERFEYQGDAQISDSVRTVFGAEHETSRFTDGFSPAKTGVTSGYVQAIVDPLENVTITGGARLDDHRTYGSEATFSLNASWRPSSDTTIRAAYGEGFKAPTLFQLFSFFGNQTLLPESAKSYEVGVEQKLIDGALAFGATVFQRNTTNQIDFISCFGRTTGICTSRPFGTYDNVKATRAKGLESFIRMAPSDRLTLEANYSFIKSEDRNTGQPLLRRPRHSVNASIDWKARNWLKLGADVRSVSDSVDVDFQTFARTRLDGYTLVGLRAAVPIGDTLELFGRIENLFDTRYETVSGYGTTGRNAHVGVRAKF